MKKQIIIVTILLVGFCLATTLLTVGSGFTLWLTNRATPTRRPTLPPLALSSPSPTATPSPTPTPSPRPSPTPLPTVTPSPTLSPTPPPSATPTPRPTASPTSPPPTATPSPTVTFTPAPAYTFAILETEQFPTNHPDFDIYIAVTDSDNNPLGGYRAIGSHSGGLRVESDASTTAWAFNSGAMHYKAGNIKFQALNSPQGVWTVQLVNEAGQPVAAPVELSFDPTRPTWYFILYRKS